VKVLDINNLYSPTGGGIRIYHHEKLKWCKANGIENLLLYPSTKNTGNTEYGGTVRGLKSPRLAGSGYNFFTRGEPIRQALKEFNPDVVELGSTMVVPGMVKRVLKDIPSFAFFHSNWPETLPMSVLGINKGIISRLFRKLSTPIMRRACKPMNAVIGASDYSIQKLREAHLTNIRKVPLGTNPDIFHPRMRSEELRKSLGIPDNGKMILYMGRLAPEKGIHVLLKACTHLLKQKNLVLVIAGEGHWDKKVKQKTAENPKKMKLLSQVKSRAEAAQLMASADAFVSAGPLETFSLVTLEALSCGTPVAACSHAAASELITKAGGNSIYSPWNSGEALAEAIRNAAATEKEQRNEFRAFAGKYTWDACFSKLFNVYNTHKASQ